MNNRKCREYYIVIEYQNGEKSIIEYLDEREVDNTNYKEMISVYKDTKEQFKDVSCVIRFMGRTDDNEESMEIFAKIVKSNTYYKKVDIGYELNIATVALNRIQESIKDTFDNIGLTDKRISALSHNKIEGHAEATDEYKISIFDELQRLYEARRRLKNDNRKTTSIESLIKSSIGNLSIALSRINEIDNRIEDSIEQISVGSGKEYDKNNVKEYSYENFKDRMNMMKQLQPKYDKVVHDTARELICCYNKVHN